MWTDEARQASLDARRAQSGLDTKREAARVEAAQPAAHQNATMAVPRNFMEAEKAAAQLQMENLGRSGVDRTPPTNYRAPNFGGDRTSPPASATMRDYSEKANGGERQSNYNAPRYSDVSAPTRQIADYSDKTADQGRSAGVIDKLSARYS